MRLPLLLSFIVAMAPGCRSHDAVTLASDDGKASASFDCRSSAVQMDEQGKRVVADYSLRLARKAAAAGDTLHLRQLMDLYARGDWTTLAGLAALQACREGPLAAPELTFPDPKAAAPLFALPALPGLDTVSLRSLRGRLVLIDFWGTWCGPCVQQMPDVVALANDFPDRLAVVAILFMDTPERAQAWLATHPPGRVIHLIDPGRRVAAQYDIERVPWSFVLDEGGRVLASPENPRVRMRLRQLRQYLTSAARPDA